MAGTFVGGFEYRGRGFRFLEARASWQPGGELTIEASGDRCGLDLIGVPFPGVSDVGELAGRVWEPSEEEISRHADTFAEGGLEVRGKRLWIMAGRIECKRFDAERRVLSIAFRLDVQDGESGRGDEADGSVHCEI